MDDAEQRIAALQSQMGRLQAEVLALRISGGYIAHALTGALIRRGVITAGEVSGALELYAEGFEGAPTMTGLSDASVVERDVAETLKRQAAEVLRVVAMFESPKAA
jgi:hypothetical protein